ncbi:MAG TPA: hypothetical protein VKB35_11275 [Ktedonobacteraceae bacterium]|nr:hypothetical protein [Ktedonobacteraceae bacterium]
MLERFAESSPDAALPWFGLVGVLPPTRVLAHGLEPLPMTPLMTPLMTRPGHTSTREDEVQPVASAALHASSPDRK